MESLGFSVQAEPAHRNQRRPPNFSCWVKGYISQSRTQQGYILKSFLSNPYLAYRTKNGQPKDEQSNFTVLLNYCFVFIIAPSLAVRVETEFTNFICLCNNSMYCLEIFNATNTSTANLFDFVACAGSCVSTFSSSRFKYSAISSAFK